MKIGAFLRTIWPLPYLYSSTFANSQESVSFSHDPLKYNSVLMLSIRGGLGLEKILNILIDSRLLTIFANIHTYRLFAWLGELFWRTVAILAQGQESGGLPPFGVLSTLDGVTVPGRRPVSRNRDCKTHALAGSASALLPYAAEAGKGEDSGAHAVV